jgi:fructokinase
MLPGSEGAQTRERSTKIARYSILRYSLNEGTTREIFMSESPLMVGLGEVLWDLLPSGKVLGGAPANFAYMATVFGNRGIVASRLGNDDLGHEAYLAMNNVGLDTSYVQVDALNETGVAGVLLDSEGQPNFTIKKDVAWDFLQWTPAWEELSSRVDVVCYGTLAQRSQTSASTIERFLQNTPSDALCICDANLREHFYSVDSLRRSFQFADIVKLNEQELFQVSSSLELGGTGEIEISKKLLRAFDLDLVCVTKGARGSLLVSEREQSAHAGIDAEVADAIGAGDAFTACVAHYYLQGRALDEISELANRFAAWVATQVGATPSVSEEQLAQIMGIDSASEGTCRKS